MDWESVYAELTNKLRWAIGSTVASTMAGHMNLPYRSQQDLARTMASELVEEFKRRFNKPNYEPSMKVSAGESPSGGTTNNRKSTNIVPKTP